VTTADPLQSLSPLSRIPEHSSSSALLFWAFWESAIVAGRRHSHCRKANSPGASVLRRGCLLLDQRLGGKIAEMTTPSVAPPIFQGKLGFRQPKARATAHQWEFVAKSHQEKLATRFHRRSTETDTFYTVNGHKLKFQHDDR